MALADSTKRQILNNVIIYADLNLIFFQYMYQHICYTFFKKGGFLKKCQMEQFRVEPSITLMKYPD